MGTMIGRIRTDLSSPAGAYDEARKIAKVAVKLEKFEQGTVGASIDSLTRKGHFGSWFLKLYKGHSVSIHLHLYVRLVEIVEELAVKTRAEADRVEDLVAEAKGERNEEGNQAAASRRKRDYTEPV